MKNIIPLLSIILFYATNVNAQQGDLEVTGTVKVGTMLPSDSDSIVVWGSDGTLGRRNDMVSMSYLDAVLLNVMNSLSRSNETFTSDTTGTVKDVDGNIYTTVKIGSQWWMAENLRTTNYSNGSAITYVQDSAEWSVLTTEGYCFYDTTGTGYSTYSQETFGALYNWFAVSDSRGLCPSGWHMPSDEEWTTLIDYLDPGAVDPNAVGSQSTFAGQKMKEVDTIYWIDPIIGASNDSGFSGLPGGARLDDGIFSFVGYFVTWWSASEDTNSAWARFLNAGVDYIAREKLAKEFGLSVRCLRD